MEVPSAIGVARCFARLHVMSRDIADGCPKEPLHLSGFGVVAFDSVGLLAGWLGFEGDSPERVVSHGNSIALRSTLPQQDSSRDTGSLPTRLERLSRLSGLARSADADRPVRRSWHGRRNIRRAARFGAGP